MPTMPTSTRPVEIKSKSLPGKVDFSNMDPTCSSVQMDDVTSHIANCWVLDAVVRGSMVDMLKSVEKCDLNVPEAREAVFQGIRRALDASFAASICLRR